MSALPARISRTPSPRYRVVSSGVATTGQSFCSRRMTSPESAFAHASIPPQIPRLRSSPQHSTPNSAASARSASEISLKNTLNSAAFAARRARA